MFRLGFYVIHSPPMFREGRVMQTVQKYIPTSNMYITKRVGNVAPLGMLKQNSFGGNFNRVTQNGPSEVTETDLYLLGAIEKLVYRVDYMENRLRKAEQLIYYLMAGNNQNQHKKEIEGKMFTISREFLFIVPLLAQPRAPARRTSLASARAAISSSRIRK